jgi:hypothetical protein
MNLNSDFSDRTIVSVYRRNVMQIREKAPHIKDRQAVRDLGLLPPPRISIGLLCEVLQPSPSFSSHDNMILRTSMWSGAGGKLDVLSEGSR